MQIPDDSYELSLSDFKLVEEVFKFFEENYPYVTLKQDARELREEFSTAHTAWLVHG